MTSNIEEERVFSRTVLKDIALWWAVIAVALVGFRFLVDDRLGLMVVGTSVLLAATCRTFVGRLVDIGRLSPSSGSAFKFASSALAVAIIFLVGWIVI